MAITKPNILLVCTDHWPGQLLGAAGHPVVMTPTVDQLTRCGTHFTNAYSACPSCIPARRGLLTGMSPRAHGLRTYREGVDFLDDSSLIQTFREVGYQTYGVGKLHVFPQRNRVGFDDILVDDQGRHQFREIPDGDADDYELFLAEQGFGGQEYASGMPHNDFLARNWHLPESCHPINWATREMCRFIRRRDPRKPGFWYLSYSTPHPPLTPLSGYMDLYRDVELDPTVLGDWAQSFEHLPYHLKTLSNVDTLAMARARPHEQSLSRRAYYATLTHIDHQIRVVLGYLRENDLLDNTIVVFTSDHGHMVGEHGLWCMTPFYEMSAHIPLVIVPRKVDGRLGVGVQDDRLAEFGDILPTLLDLADVEVPAGVDRLSLSQDCRRQHLYGEHGEAATAMRMVRQGDHKLIYYPVGNRLQLFDVVNDPRECRDLAVEKDHLDVRGKLMGLLMNELYGDDRKWIVDERLVGMPDREYIPKADRTLRNQRGLRFM